MTNKKLEEKLYIAKQSPEPVFDLSDCNLKRIPSVYATIRVLRKEALYLQNNQLTSIENGGNLKDLFLIKLLDLRHNKIKKLSGDIKYLINLQVLRLDDNGFTSLPSEIGFLLNLEQLTVSSNELDILPDNICSLTKLHILDLRKNKLRSLPECIHQNKALQSLLLDENNEWITPPKSIISEGTSAILSYFAEKNSVKNMRLKFTDREDGCSISSSLGETILYDETMQENLRRLEKEKTERRSRQIVSEMDNSNYLQRELMVLQRNQDKKRRLLVDLITQNCKIEEEVQIHQEARRLEQDRFVEELQNVGRKADHVINLLLDSRIHEKKHSIKSLISSLNEEFPVKQNLSLQTVLESMEKILIEEGTYSKCMEKKDIIKEELISSTHSKENTFQSKLRILLSDREKQKNSLIKAIKEDNDLQRNALLMLIEKSDHRNIELQNQLSLIQNQLSNLTMLELHNKRLHFEQQMNEIAMKRVTLSNILVKIIEEQRAYRHQIAKDLYEMKNRQSSDDIQNYWLMQYQKLLSCQPNSTKCVNPNFLHELALYGVSHYAPILAFHYGNFESVETYINLTDSALKKIGINCYEDRCAILKVIHILTNEQKPTIIPSAPELNDSNESHHLPSAPLADICIDSHSHKQYSVNECVICMDKESRIIFLPCGHFCSCMHCSISLMNCPLCRCDITHKIEIFPP